MPPEPTPPGPPTKVLLRARRIVTLDPVIPLATAVAIENGRVRSAGTDADFDTWMDASTQILDVGEGIVYPGFVESHGHLLGIGRQESRLYVGSPPCRSVADILDRLQDAARRTPVGEWIVGAHYDDTLLEEGRPPTLEELTAACPDHPVYLSHMSGHLAVANRQAFERAGVTDDTVVHGLMRDGDGRLTGEMRESKAMGLVSPLLPKPSHEDRLAWIRRGSEVALSRGTTSMSESGFGSADGDEVRAAWHAYREASEGGLLQVRTQVFPVLRARHFIPGTWNDGFLSIGPTKLFADGSIQGHTGALEEDYCDLPGERGSLFWELDALSDTLQELWAEKRQVAIHANGDRAIEQVLTAFERVFSKNPVGPDGSAWDPRWRIEHAQTATWRQLERMQAISVFPSFFVNHVEVFGDRHRDLFLGPNRAENISPAAWAVRLGLPFSFHSDVPVTPVDPLQSLRTAVTRQTGSGAVLGTAQAVPPLTALKAYTLWAAYLGHREADVGSLRPGAWADAVVLARDLDTISDPGPLPEIRSVYLGGRQVV